MDSPLVLCWGLVLLFALAAGLRSAAVPGSTRGVLALACAALVAHAAVFWSFTVDDAFITFRFSRSWIEGLGPNYQAGEHVEGFTSFGWMAVLAVCGKLGLDLVTASKVLGLAAACAALPAVHAVALRATGSARAALAAALLLALNPLQAAWSVAGMETPVFAAFVIWGVRARLERRRVAGLPLDAALFGLSVWMRPEGFLFGTLVWLTVAVGRGRPHWIGAARWALTATAFALPFWMWRWSYYGEFFPNTFYAKMPDLGLRLAAGTLALRDFATEMTPAIWVPLLASLASLRSGMPLVPLGWVALGGYAAFVLWTGGDVLHLRFFVHVLPLVAVLWSVGLTRLLAPVLARIAAARAPAPAPGPPRRATRERAPHPVPLGVRLALASALVLTGVALGVARDARALGSLAQFGPGYVVNNARNVHEVNLPLGEWLRLHAPERSQLATWDIGGIGWNSHLPILDLYGLTDAEIARLIHSGAPAAERIHYLLDQRPELLVTYARPAGPDWGWLAPAADSIMRDYHFHSLWRARTSGYWLVLLARDDVTLPPAPLETQAFAAPAP